MKDRKIMDEYYKGIPKLFRVIRQKDETGLSGTGHVLTGIVFENGKTIIQWVSNADKQSIAIYPSFEIFQHYHIDSHPENKTILQWIDMTPNIWTKNSLINNDFYEEQTCKDPETHDCGLPRKEVKK